MLCVRVSCRHVKVTIVSVWLNSAACVVCVMLASQGDHCQGVMWLNCAACVMCVCVCVHSVGRSR